MEQDANYYYYGTHSRNPKRSKRQRKRHRSHPKPKTVVDYGKHRTRKYRLLDLPFDIIIDILSKCPPKSIMRIRQVSRSCYQITKDPKFVNFHLNIGLSKPPSYILAETRHHNIYLSPMKALYLLEERKPKWRATKFGVEEKIGGAEVQIVGSCRGLLCFCKKYLSSEEPIFIYNPITREYLPLPRILDENLFMGGYCCSISFEFDVVSKKYKVVMISRPKTGGNGMAAYIITVGENSWRKLTISSEFEFIEYVRSGRKSVFFNGLFYWIIFKEEESGYVTRVLSMDICQEKFEEINFIDVPTKKPSVYEERDSGGKEYYLVKFGKALAAIAYNIYKADMQIWVLEDYCKGIWSHHSDHNMLSFGNHPPHISRDDGYDCRIEGTIGDETLLMEYFDDNLSDYFHYFGLEKRHHLVAYSPGRREFKFDFVRQNSIPYCFDIVTFVPSFVSLMS